MENYFKKYQIIKKKLSCRYLGYNLADIMAIDIITHIYQHKKADIEVQTYRQILSKLKQFPYISNVENLFQSPNILFTIPNYLSKRDDYCEFIRLTCEKVKDSKLVVIEIQNKTKSIQFKKIEFGNFVFSVLRNYTKLFTILTFKEVLYFSCLLLYYKRLINYLESIDDQQMETKKYVAFNGALKYEYLLITFFRKKEIPTYSLQHAIMDRYFLDNMSPPYDLINIENLRADYLLCWSKETIDQIRKYNTISSKLLLAGNPKYSPWKLTNIKQSFQKCLVFLGGIGDELINLEVINIIEQVSKIRRDIEFVFKLHPQQLNKSYHQKMITEYNIKIVPTNQTLSALLVENDFDFTISYNLTTTVYYDSLCYGLLSFRYNRDHLINFYGLSNDHFSTAEELVERISKFKQLDSGSLREKIQVMLEHTVGINIDNYHKHLF